MSPELITAIKERIEVGHELEAIRAELRNAGYDEQTIEAAVAAAQSGQSVPTPIPTANSSTSEASTTTSTLPGVGELLKEGFTFVRQRPDMLALVVAPLVIMASFDFVIAYNPALFLLVLTAYIPVAIFYLFAITTALYLTFQSNTQAISVSDGLRWAGRNVWGLLWIWILSALVIGGGFVLLIIPGIIVMVYTALSQYVYVAEGQRGMGALLRSRALVLGNWWPLAIRLFLVSLFYVLALLLIGLVVGLLLTIIGLPFDESVAGEFIFNLIAQVLGGVFLIVGLKIGFVLYEALAANRPLDASVPSDGKGKYITLAFVGLLFPVLVGVLVAVVLASLSNARDIGFQSLLHIELDTMQPTAELYYTQDQAGRGYEGVCGTFDQIATGEIIACVDSKTGWALVAESDFDGVRYCIDATSTAAPGRLSEGGTTCEFNPDPKQRASELRQNNE